MAGATLDVESSCEIHCDHQRRARDEYFNVFHDPFAASMDQHKTAGRGVNMESTRDKSCTEHQEDSIIAHASERLP
jgi:hypothetical protein